jgi:hypothetical protein
MRNRRLYATTAYDATTALIPARYTTPVKQKKRRSFRHSRRTVPSHFKGSVLRLILGIERI